MSPPAAAAAAGDPTPFPPIESFLLCECAGSRMGLLSIIRKIKRKEKKRLAGASLFVLANKQDNQGALKPAEIAKAVCSSWMPWMSAGILID
uniref:Uncharacterized protein n=1 Tax=Oryza nivara TaxID=4536 RepID=A0A0E0J914_ORYNI